MVARSLCRAFLRRPTTVSKINRARFASLPVRHEGYPDGLDRRKVDPELGWKVHRHLDSLGLQTPTVENTMVDADQVEKIQENFREIMETMGLDLTNDSLVDTPKRVARMFMYEMFWGLNPEYFPRCTAVANEMNYDSM
eukprot:242134-Amorphochlora_amoeboformis.AAC.1